MGAAERNAAQTISADPRPGRRRTVGGDKTFDTNDFINITTEKPSLPLSSRAGLR